MPTDQGTVCGVDFEHESEEIDEDEDSYYFRCTECEEEWDEPK